MADGLHIVGWPLLLGVASELAGVRGQASAPRRVLRAGLVVLHLCVAIIAIYAVLALARTASTEWVESGVGAIARYWVAGGNVFPPAALLGKYGVFPYGPVLFQVVGGIYALAGHSARAVRVVYDCFALLSYLLLYLMLRRADVGARASALAVEMFAVVVGIMGFMVKADIMLILIAVLACRVVASGRGQIFSGAGLAVLGGLALSIKIHGIFYILPAAVECLAIRPTRMAMKTAAAGALALAVAAAPFLVPGTSLENYVFILRTAAHDGLLFGIFLSNVLFIVMCAAGVHLLTAPQMRDAAYWRLMLSVLAAGFLVSVFAAKAEAGPHHLIPLLPYLCLPLGRGLDQAFDARRAVLLVLFLVSFQPVTSVVADIAIMLAHWHGVSPVI
jgi:hypothetical protein